MTDYLVEDTALLRISVWGSLDILIKLQVSCKPFDIESSQGAGDRTEWIKLCSPI